MSISVFEAIGNLLPSEVEISLQDITEMARKLGFSILPSDGRWVTLEKDNFQVRLEDGKNHFLEWKVKERIDSRSIEIYPKIEDLYRELETAFFVELDARPRSLQLPEATKLLSTPSWVRARIGGGDYYVVCFVSEFDEAVAAFQKKLSEINS